MKKYLAIILALAMALCLCACTGNDADPDTSEDNPSVSDSSSPNTAVDDDVLVVDPDSSEGNADTDETDADDSAGEDAKPTEETDAPEDTAPKRTHFSDSDKESAKSAATEMVKADNQQQDATVYELKVTDLYNCVVTVGYKTMENEKETLFLSDYDLHYDNGQWVKTAAYNRGSFDTSIYEIGYDEAGSLVINPEQN